MKLIGGWVSQVLLNPKNHSLRLGIKQQVEDLCEKFPIYKDLINW
jgi:hypothetical protein